jgi:hypothetical protein
MKTNYLIILLTSICLSSVFAQHNLNSYKYIIVEKQFHFQNDPGQYNLNNLVKFEFQKLGFEVIMQDQELPADLKSNYCLALNSEVIAKGVLRTKAKVILRNCDAEIVYTSEEGVTKEKDFSRTYGIAIRNAFLTMNHLNYDYIPNEKVKSVSANTEDVKMAEAKIEKLEAEIIELKKEEKVNKVVEPVEEPEKRKTDETTSKKESVKFLQANPISNGFQIVDESSEEIMILVHTALKDVFVVKDKNAIVFKKDGKWFYSKNNEEESKMLNLKF